MTDCVHHWRIAPAAGPTSAGVCLKCGDEREFRNSLDDYGPAERSAKALTAICSSEYGKLRPLAMAEAYRE